MRATFELSAPVIRTPRVIQTAGMMDVPLTGREATRWDIDLPLEGKSWSVGLVVGPSGSGKSSVIRHLWPDQIASDYLWSDNASLLDGFPPQLGIRDVTRLLTAVGLGSVPAWLRPFGTLSNGEAFRAQIARALAETDGLLVVDEFTSVVDRQVAKVASHSVQKAVRKAGRQLVAATCHYDVVDWLQPDWVLDMAGGTFTWRSQRPHPPIRLEVYPLDHTAWRVFGRHHYLSATLHTAAQCFGGFVNGECVAFTSYLHFPHARTRNIKMGHRLVVLPDWQGLGIGGQLDDWLGQHLYERGFRYHNVVAHPAMIAYYSRSPRWSASSERRTQLSTSSADKSLRGRNLHARFLGTRSFVYVPPAKGV